MLSNKIKKLQQDETGAANAIIMILFMPVAMLFLFFSVDMFINYNTEQEYQLKLDNAAYAAAQYATETACIINEDAINAGKMLFDKNNNLKTTTVIFTDLSTAQQREQGVVHFQLIGSSENLFVNTLLPKPYKHKFFLESTAVCSRFKEN